MEDLWQAHYQILSIIFLKEFIKLNVNTDTMIKKCKTCRIKYKYCNCFLEYTKFKDNLIEHKCLYCNKNYQETFDEKLIEKFLIHTNILTTTIISFLYCSEKVFILRMYGWLRKIQRNILIWKRKFLQWLKCGRYYWCRLRAPEKSLLRFWKKKENIVICMFKAIHYC